MSFKRRPLTLAQAQAVLNGAFIPEPMEAAALQVLSEALAAKTWVRGPKVDARGGREYIEVPDHAIRLAAAVKVIEWRRGKPTQQVDLNSPLGGHPLPTPADAVGLLMKNPDLVQRILRGFAASGRDAKTIEVAAEPVGAPAVEG